MDVIGEDVVTFTRREVIGEDRYGNDVYLDHDTTVPGCSLQPQWGSEEVGAGDVVTERYLLRVPGLALSDLEIDPMAIDAIRAYGIPYEINGQPQVWRTALGIDHIVIYCRRVTG